MLANSEMFTLLPSEAQAVLLEAERLRAEAVVNERIEREAFNLERQLCTDANYKRRLRRVMVEKAKVSTSDVCRAEARRLCSSLALTEDEQSFQRSRCGVAGVRQGAKARSRKRFRSAAGIGLPAPRRQRATVSCGTVRSYGGGATHWELEPEGWQGPPTLMQWRGNAGLDCHGRARRLRRKPNRQGLAGGSWWNERRVYTEAFDRSVASLGDRKKSDAVRVLSQQEMDAHFLMVGTDRCKVIVPGREIARWLGNLDLPCKFPRVQTFVEARYLVSRARGSASAVERSEPKRDDELRMVHAFTSCRMCQNCTARARAQWKLRARDEMLNAGTLYAFMATLTLPNEFRDALHDFAVNDAREEVDRETGEVISLDFAALPDSVRCSRQQHSVYPIRTRFQRRIADALTGGRSNRQAALTAPLRWMSASELGEQHKRFHIHMVCFVGASAVDRFRLHGVHDRGRLGRELEALFRAEWCRAWDIPVERAIVDIQFPKDPDRPLAFVSYVTKYATKWFGMVHRPRLMTSQHFGQSQKPDGTPGFLPARAEALTADWMAVVRRAREAQAAFGRDAAERLWRFNNGVNRASDELLVDALGGYERSDRPPD